MITSDKQTHIPREIIGIIFSFSVSILLQLPSMYSKYYHQPKFVLNKAWGGYSEKWMARRADEFSVAFPLLVLLFALSLVSPFTWSYEYWNIKVPLELRHFFIDQLRRKLVTTKIK